MIARMKRFISIVLIICALLSAPAAFLSAPATLPVGADPLRYAVAADSNVWFYSSESEDSKLFLIPETYYVRVLSEGDVFSAVEYLVNDAPDKKVMGYCRTSALTFVSFIPARPFLRKTITVSYSLPDAGLLGGEFSSVQKTFVYYGMRYESGQLYFYVLDGTSFGYIPAESPIDFERNDDWLNVEEPPVSGETEPPMPDESPSVVQIIIICVICAAAVIVAAFVLRGRKREDGGDS